MHPEDRNFDLEQRLKQQMSYGEKLAGLHLYNILDGCKDFHDECARLIGYCSMLISAYYATAITNKPEKAAIAFMESFLIEMTEILQSLGQNNVHFQFVRLSPEKEL